MNLFNPDRLITFPADDPQLVKQLQSGTKVYLAKSGDHRYADGWAFAKMAALIIACLCCYALALSQSLWGLYLLWYLAMMFCAMLLAVNVVHDASHDAFLRGKKTNARLNRWVAFPMGLDPDCWRVRHVRSNAGGSARGWEWGFRIFPPRGRPRDRGFANRPLSKFTFICSWGNALCVLKRETGLQVSFQLRLNFFAFGVYKQISDPYIAPPQRRQRCCS